MTDQQFMNRWKRSHAWTFVAAMTAAVLIVAVLNAATAHAAPRRRATASTAQIPQASSTTAAGVVQRKFGIHLDVNPQVSANSTGNRRRALRPSFAAQLPSRIPPRGNGGSTVPSTTPPGRLPRPHFVPPPKTPTRPPVVVNPTAPSRPRFPTRPPIVKIPEVNVPPSVRPIPPSTGGAPSNSGPSIGKLPRPTLPSGKPLVIVAEDVEGEVLVKKPLGKLPPKIGKGGTLLDPSLADTFGPANGGQPDKKLADELKNVIGPSFQDKLANGDLNKLVQSGLGKKLKLGQQWKLKAGGGDVAMLLGPQKMLAAGGWKTSPCFGPIGPGFLGGCFGGWCCGPCYYPAYCWYPHWCGWVDWCWWDTCPWYCNPLPYWCQPMWCNPCPGWVYWNCPGWVHLPLCHCGTWWNVPQVVIPASDADLQLLAVRMVDSGHPDKKIGAEYRIYVRNNCAHRVLGNFNVMIFAANDERLADTLPQAGARIEAIAPGEVRTIDLRLPAAANAMGIDEHGRAVPFRFLHVLVDSHREVFETFENNNGAILDRTKILLVDPTAFAVDTNAAEVGTQITIAGEGFGPLPGKVVVSVGELSFEARIEGWCGRGVRVTLEGIPLADAADAELVVIRRDGAAANPLTLRILPGTSALSALAPPTP